MRHLLVLLLTTTCLQGQVRAQAPAAALPPCDKAVRFGASWFADPEVDHGKTAAELTKLGGADAGGGAGAGAGAGGIQLGHVTVVTKITVVPQTTCQGVLVRLDYVKPVLRVASEMPLGSCAYARVMNHEQVHVRIHRDIARQFRELDYPWAARGNSAAVLAFAKQELDRLMRAQELFDSPEEYAKNHSVCGGAISQLVKPAATPAKAGQKPEQRPAQKPG